MRTDFLLPFTQEALNVLKAAEYQDNGVLNSDSMRKHHGASSLNIHVMPMSGQFVIQIQSLDFSDGVPKLKEVNQLKEIVLLGSNFEAITEYLFAEDAHVKD